MAGIDIRGNEYNMEDLEKIRRRLALKANARLRSLEKANREFWAYTYATNYTKMTRNSTRFSSAKKWKGNKRGIIKEIDELQAFLGQTTSTVSGSKRVENRIVNTLNSKYGINIDEIGRKEFFDFIDFYNTEFGERQKLSSEFAIDFYSRSKEKGLSEEKIKDAIERYSKGAIRNLKELYSESGLKVLR